MKPTFRLRLVIAVLLAGLAYVAVPAVAYADKGGGGSSGGGGGNSGGGGGNSGSGGGGDDHGGGDDDGGDDHGGGGGDDGDDDDDGGGSGGGGGGSGGGGSGGKGGGSGGKGGGGGSGSGSSGSGHSDDDHDRARALVQKGEIHSLQEIVRGLAKKVPGEIVSVSLKHRGAAWVYSFRIVDPHGKLVQVDVDAKRMTILGKSKK